MRVIAISAMLAAFAGCAHADGVPGPGLCAASETSYFACQTTKKRWISLCGKAPHSLQYRFGTPAKPELRYPDDPAAGAASFLFAHYFRYQTDRAEVTFRNHGVDYAVFDYTEGRDRHAGVRVTTAAGKDVELVCSGKVSSRLLELKGILKCDPDNALNVGSCR